MLHHNPMSRCITGGRYEAEVPDTLDLAERMGLAINAMTNVWDPEEKHSLAFNVDFSHRPAIMTTNHLTDAYLNIPPKFLEALAVCRLASGSDLNLDVDAQVIASQLDLLGDDGLTYCPTDTLGFLSESPPFAEIWGEGRSLLALTMLAQVDDDPRWREIATRKVDRLLSLSRQKGDFRYLWKGRFLPGEEVPPDADEPTGNRQDGSLLDRYADPRMSIIYSVGALGHGSGLFSRLTGYEPAMELARGLARWALSRVFTDPDGRWDIYHFHHSLYALMAVCEYGYAAEDRDVLERVDACYRWAREMGDPLIGYYTEWMPGSDLYLEWQQGNSVEICEVADMVFLALYLTRAGTGDYWDDVDRWVRNVYAEGQMTNADFLDRIPAAYFDSGDHAQQPGKDTRDVAARSVGSFFGWMRANDGIRVTKTDDGPKLPGHAIMHCCTANGARTLYHVWDSIVTRTPEMVRVNLLLNRASPWLDVDSYLPVEGKVVLSIKATTRVAVRLPEWCRLEDVEVTVGDEGRRARTEGRYVELGELHPGDRVVLAFPLPERVLHRVIGDIPYRLELRGANVVSIDPGGLAYPLYANQPSGKPVQRERFVPEIQDLIW